MPPITETSFMNVLGPGQFEADQAILEAGLPRLAAELAAEGLQNPDAAETAEAISLMVSTNNGVILQDPTFAKFMAQVKERFPEIFALAMQSRRTATENSAFRFSRKYKEGPQQLSASASSDKPARKNEKASPAIKTAPTTTNPGPQDYATTLRNAYVQYIQSAIVAIEQLLGSQFFQERGDPDLEEILQRVVNLKPWLFYNSEIKPIEIVKLAETAQFVIAEETTARYLTAAGITPPTLTLPPIPEPAASKLRTEALRWRLNKTQTKALFDLCMSFSHPLESVLHYISQVASYDRRAVATFFDNYAQLSHHPINHLSRLAKESLVERLGSSTEPIENFSALLAVAASRQSHFRFVTFPFDEGGDAIADELGKATSVFVTTINNNDLPNFTEAITKAIDNAAQARWMLILIGEKVEKTFLRNIFDKHPNGQIVLVSPTGTTIYAREDVPDEKEMEAAWEEVFPKIEEALNGPNGNIKIAAVHAVMLFADMGVEAAKRELEDRINTDPHIETIIKERKKQK